MYQRKDQEKGLRWIQNRLKLGYVSRRNDGMSEYRIDGHESVIKVLNMLEPYSVFKKAQVKHILRAEALLQKRNLTPKEFLSICKLSDKVASFNYSVCRKYTSEIVKRYFRKLKLLSP